MDAINLIEYLLSLVCFFLCNRKEKQKEMKLKFYVKISLFSGSFIMKQFEKFSSGVEIYFF